MRAKKNQIWFETNLGYEETKDRLFKSGLVVGDDQDFGRFSFKLKNFKDYSVQITRGGKLGIYYQSVVVMNLSLSHCAHFL